MSIDDLNKLINVSIYIFPVGKLDSVEGEVVNRREEVETLEHDKKTLSDKVKALYKGGKQQPHHALLLTYLNTKADFNHMTNLLQLQYQSNFVCTDTCNDHL